MQEHIRAGISCFQRLCPPPECARRTAAALEALQLLAEYHALLADLESGEADACHGLQAQLADRAFEAEGSLRILLAEGLRTINDLRDSGLLHAAVADFGQSAASGGGLAQAFHGVRKRVKELARAFPDAALDEGSRAIERRDLTVEYDGESNVLILRGNPPFLERPPSPGCGSLPGRGTSEELASMTFSARPDGLACTRVYRRLRPRIATIVATW